ncbi:MAG: hypothetical protein JST92_13220, partial [Deltaproteobacteria bacterium]|nr:hypothetical protein [Deltaproteobacteria bacterium]
PSANLFSPYANQVLLAYGTAGTDTVAAMPATTSTVSGAVHVLPLGLTGRVLPSDLKSDLTGAKLTHIQQLGAAYEVGTSKNGTSPASGSYPLYLSNGDRVYGSIIWDEVNGRLLFGTTSGSVTDIDKRGTESGNIYSIDTMASAGSEGLTKFASNTGGIGGTLAYDADSGTVLASTDQSIYKVTGSPTSPNKVVYSVDGTDSSAQGLLGWILRRSGREY